MREDILDKTAIEDISHIRISKPSQTVKYSIIRCPVCGTESGKLSKTKAFCPECLREFTIGDSVLEKVFNEKEYAVCNVCGKFKSKQDILKSGICGFCRLLQRDYIEGKCGICGKEKPIHKKTGLCYYYHCDTRRKRRETDE